MTDCMRDARKLAILANVIATAMTENLTPSQQNVLGNLIVQVGSTILSIAAAAQACEDAKSGGNGEQKTSAQGEETAASGGA